MSKYSIIPTEKRIRLIEMIQQQNFKIVQSARQLGIKIATAKSILRSYKKYGKILQKKEKISNQTIFENQIIPKEVEILEQKEQKNKDFIISSLQYIQSFQPNNYYNQQFNEQNYQYIYNNPYYPIFASNFQSNMLL